MGSKIALKNAQDQEFSINHLDNAGAISINSSDIVTTGTTQSISGAKTFTTSPTAPTPTAGDDSTKIATTAFVLANSAAVISTTIGTATAGLADGGVGTYAFLARKTANVAIINGSTYAGSDLRYTGVVQNGDGNYPYGGGYNTTVVSGTWRAVGFCSNNSGKYSSTIFLRIA